MNEKLYRLRPAEDLSIEEIKNHYLWFSRPSGFNDIQDSNIMRFVKENDSIKESFKDVFIDYKEVLKLASYTGICCFTNVLPPSKEWQFFP